MELRNLLSITNENTNMYIHYEDNIVSYYDGRNSIDEYYNDFIVVQQWMENNSLHVEITK